MNLNEKCCNALGCRSEIEDRIQSLESSVIEIANCFSGVAPANIISMAFGQYGLMNKVQVGDVCIFLGRAMKIPNLFAADLINSEISNACIDIPVWRNENA